MQIIIQHFLEKITNTLQNNLKNLNNINNLSDFTDDLQADLMSFGREFTQNYIKMVEDEIYNSSKRKEEYVSIQSFPRELITIFGVVKFSRRYYEEKKTKEKLFLLDRALGLANKERLLKNVEENILEIATRNSYEYAGKKAAYDTVITKETVKNKISVLNFKDVENKTFESKKDILQLYIQADEDHVSLQSGGIAMPRLITVYEEKEKGKLIGKRKFGGMYNKSIDDLWEQVLSYIEDNYNYEKIDRIFIMGDGASWIKTGLEWLPKSKYIADKFHIMKAIISMTGNNKEYVPMLREAIYELDFKKVKELEYEILAEEMDKNKRIRMEKTLKYILNNETGIKNSILYDVPGCSAEGDISHTLSARLSSRPMGWSENNVDKMARLRILAANGENIQLITRNTNNLTEEKKKVVEEHEKVYKMISSRTFKRADGISFSIPEMKYGEYEMRQELQKLINFKVI